MSGSQNRWTLRLSTEGADQVVRDLRAAATESAAAARAYDTLIKAQPQLATGAERAEIALRKNVDAMKGMRGELSVLGAAAEGAASSMGRFGAALTSPTAAIAALGAASTAGVVQIARLGDEYTNTMNKLRAATGSVQAASAVYGQLVALSQQTGASISESAGAFVRFSVAARAIGATNGEVIQLTRTIQQAGLISGASTQEAAAGVQQLGQALASGTLQGDELRSILENMPTLAEALARELGVSVGQLRTMGSEGQLTSDRVFQALLRAGEGINRQFTELTPTMGRAFGILGQAMVEFVGKLDQALGLSQGIAAAAQRAAEVVRGIRVGPRSPGEQAQFDVDASAQSQAALRAEIERLRAEVDSPDARRGTSGAIGRAGRAGAASREQRLAELEASYQEEIRISENAQLRLLTIQDEAARAQFGDQQAANERRLAAQREATTTAFNTTRDSLDRERKLRADHAARLTAIDAGLANGDTNAAGAARLRRIANEELADGLKALENAARGRIETDESLAAVMRVVIDIEKDREALMREGGTLTQSVRTEAEKYADTLANLNNLLAAGAITQDTYNRAVAAADPAVKAAEEASRRIEQENTRTTDRITSFFGDAFARAFEGTGNGFRGLMDSFKRAAISTFASIAAQAIIRPIVAPIVQASGLGGLGGSSSGGFSLGGIFGGQAQAATPSAATGGGGAGSLSSFGTLRQAYNGLTSPGGLGAFFPGGGAANTGFRALDGVLNTSLISPTVGPAGVVGAFPDAAGFQSLVDGTGSIGSFPSAAGFQAVVDGTSTLGSFPSAAGFQSLVDGTATLGASTTGGLSIAGSLGPLAAIGGGAFEIYNGLQKGGVGGALGAAGGAVSTITGLGMLGSAAGLLPALGALGPIGLGVGALLAIAGALLPGGKPSGQGQLARSNLGTGDLSFDGLTGSRFSQGNRDAASGAVASITRLANEIGDRLGGARIGGTASVGVTNSTLYLDIEGAKGQFANNEDGAKQLADRAAEIIFQRFKDEFARKGRNDETAAVLFNSANKDELAANLQWYEGTYKALTKTGEATSAFAQQLEALSRPYDEAIAKARSLSLAEGVLVKKRDEAIAKATAARDAEVANLYDTLEMRRITAGLAAGNLEEARSRVELRQVSAAATQQVDEFKAQLEAAGVNAAEVATKVAELVEVQAVEIAQRGQLASAIKDQLGINASNLSLLERAKAAGLGVDAVWLEEAQARVQGVRDMDELTRSLRTMGATAEDAVAQVALLTNVQRAEKDQREAARKQASDQAAALAAAEASQKLRDAFLTAQSAYTSALAAEIGTREQSISVLRQNTDALKNVAAGLRSFAAGLRLDESLSPLTIEQRLAEARRQYDAAFTGAQSGPPEDRARQAGLLANLGNTRLGLASSFFAPGTAGYVAEFEKVSGGITTLADQFGMAASVDELSLRAQEASLGVLRDQLKAAQEAGQTAKDALSVLRQAFLQTAEAAGVRVGGWAWDTPDPRPMGAYGARASGDFLFGGKVTAGEELNSASVNALYRQFLGRDAEAGVVDQWRQFGGRGFDLASALQQSAEFQARLKAAIDNLAVVTAQGNMAVVGAVEGQTEVLVESATQRMPVPV